MSLVRKEQPELLGAKMTVLLMELSQLVPCAWNADNVVLIAKHITDSFWMLRMDEFVYVFRRIVDGGFGKIYGSVDRGKLGQFLTTYMETERLDAEEHMRNESKSKYEPLDVPSEVAREVLMSMQDKVRENEKKQRPAPTQEVLDERQWGYFLAHKERIETESLAGMLKNAELAGFKKTAEAIREEMGARA